MTKEMILKYNWFVDNEYLDQYLDLVNNSQSIGKVEKHHVIPAYYYCLKFPKLRVHYRTIANHDIDEEIVMLSVADHIKAHKLLIDCTAGPLKEKMIIAYNCMIKLEQPAVHKKSSKCKSTESLAKSINKQKSKKCTKKKSKSKKRYASKAEWPSTIKHNLNKAINEIAKKLWHADRTRSWEDCKAEATAIYNKEH